MRGSSLTCAAVACICASASVFAPWSAAVCAVLATAALGIAALPALVPLFDRDHHVAAPHRRFRRASAVALVAATVAELVGAWRLITDAGTDSGTDIVGGPRPADLALMVAQGALCVALAVVASPERDRDISARLDATILVLVGALLSWPLILEPALRHDDLHALATTTTVVHVLLDLAMVGCVLRLVFTASVDTLPRRLFVAGALAATTADLILRWQLVHDVASGAALDLVRLLGWVAIGVATPAACRPRHAPTCIDHLGRWRLVVVLTAVLVPQSILVVEFATRDINGSQTVRIAGGVATATVALVAIRMWNLLAQTRRLEARRGAERFSALIHHSSDAIFLVDRYGIISYASPSVQAILGHYPQTCVGASLLEFLSDEGRTGIAPHLRNITEMPTGTSIPVDGHFTHASGAARSFEGTVRNLLADDNVHALVVTVRDITARRELEAQLERRAFHDELTGLANRSLFADRVGHALDRAPRRGSSDTIAVLFIDLDDFKAVNDGMGHGAGDELLCQVADRIRLCLRPGDSVARLGGDEFAVLLEDVPSVDHAAHVARRILEMLQLPMRVSDVELAVPASIGIALSDESSVEDLLRDADIAMYSAKARGKGCVVVFDEALRSMAEQRLELKVKLPEALRAGQFRVVYQPIQHVRDLDLHGFEALIRWDHPERGVVAPDDFIAVAEETGLIIDIGRWVLEEAARQAVIWNLRSERRLTMNVNVSAVQLHHLGFLDEVRTVLATTGLPADLLTIEITESVLVEHERVEAILHELRAMGIKIAIDDFGTGYSSLAYLQRFPVSSVKVDRAFVAQLADGHEPALVRSILAVAEALSLTTVAEGVETDEQLRALDALDCTLAQGFFLHEPQPPEAIDELLRAANVQWGRLEPVATH